MRTPKADAAVRVIITMGDPAGIGPELAVHAVRRALPGVTYTVIGDRQVFARAVALLGVRVPRQINFLDLANAAGRNFAWGKVRAAYGKASMQYLDAALAMLRDVKSGMLQCLVTCPISKESIHLAGYPYSGHTEYFSRRLSVSRTEMMLLNRSLKTVLATRHIPVARVARSLTKSGLVSTIRETCIGVRHFFGLASPRVAVCGLNPHASDNGVIGDEEGRIIAPAVKAVQRQWPGVQGPIPADTAVHRALAGAYDCIVTMYHDQALIPLKATHPASGVNLTLGLPFVRTSPLHGTAFDIAGKGVADPSSMHAAVACGLACCRIAASSRRP